MSLAKKIGEWTLLSFPAWSILAVGTYDILAHHVGSVVEYRVPQASRLVGPLPLSAMEKVHYSVWKCGSSIKVSPRSLGGGASLIDFNGDGILDKKQSCFGIPKHPPVYTEHPITTEDQTLYTRIIAKVKQQP